MASLLFAERRRSIFFTDGEYSLQKKVPTFDIDVFVFVTCGFYFWLKETGTGNKNNRYRFSISLIYKSD